MILVPDRPRLADRSWMVEYDDLEAQGFVWRFDHSDWQAARSTSLAIFDEFGEFLHRHAPTQLVICDGEARWEVLMHSGHDCSSVGIR